MLIVLPPSESKREPPDDGAPLDLATLSFPELTDARSLILQGVITTSGTPDALRRLQAAAGAAAEVERNRHLVAVATRPALELYSGALYDSLDVATLSPAARGRAAKHVVIVDAVFGLLRPDDEIPPYRCHICAKLVGLGPLEPRWRGLLPPLLASAAGPRALIADFRSSSYLAVGRPPDAGDRTVEIRIVRDLAGRKGAGGNVGRHVRGLVVRHLLESALDPATPAELADVLAPYWKVGLVRPVRDGMGWTADIVADN